MRSLRIVSGAPEEPKAYVDSDAVLRSPLVSEHPSTQPPDAINTNIGSVLLFPPRYHFHLDQHVRCHCQEAEVTEWEQE